jgi:tripartite-type tricarboxylate transporter receptor subunit TctC
MARKTSRSLCSLICAAALAALAVQQAAAQQGADANYPNRAIRIIVGFGAGGGNDILARLIGQKFSERWGQSVVIENKPGASAEIATEYVKNAAPDGYTLLVAANGSMALSSVMNKKLGYSPLRDFAPVGLIASFPLVIAVNPSTPVKSVRELIDYAKANPDKANCSEPSLAFQVALEQIKLKTGAPFQFIPYKSSAESITAVISGATLATLIDAGPASGAIKGGQLRALAITSAQRSPEFPDVPTMAEAGYPDLAISFWTGLFAPAATPPAIVKKLESELLGVMKLADVQTRLRTLGVVAEGRPADETRRFVEAEIARLTELVTVAKIKKE